MTLTCATDDASPAEFLAVQVYCALWSFWSLRTLRQQTVLILVKINSAELSMFSLFLNQDIVGDGMPET